MTDALVAAPETTGFQAALLMAPVDVTPTGHTQTLTWRGVAGATGGRVMSSSLAVFPETSGTGRSLGVVSPGREDTSEIVIASPVPTALLRGIRIPDLVRHEGEDDFPINGSGDLSGDLHLVLTPTGGPQPAPIIAVPALPGQSALPAQLIGGSLSGALFVLPDVAGATFRVTVVKGDAPEDFAEQTFSHGDVTLYAAPMPVGLHVDDPGGAELFAMGGPITSTTTVDVKAALNRYLGATIAGSTGSAPVAATVTVRSDVIGSASVLWTTAGGVIVRQIDGRLSAEVDGAPTALEVPSPPPGRAATLTVADVTITHHGMAIHPVSDPIPVADAGLGGPAVGDVAVTRALPPEALRDQQITRVAVIGWPRGETNLTLTVLGVSASVEGLAAPIDRDPPSVVWFDFESPLLVDRAVELSLIATRGAFGWIADPEPLVRIAIAVTPQGERVTVGEQVIDLTGDETSASGVALAGTDGWSILTDQFCTVSIANAVMEFAP